MSRPPHRRGRDNQWAPLRDVRREELDDAYALAARFRALVTSGALAVDERTRFAFFAAAARALRVARNPPAMFAAMVRENRWDVIGIEDEDRARVVLARLNGVELRRRRKPRRTCWSPTQ